jgi:orotidine-5'-phosphate decarboxylase
LGYDDKYAHNLSALVLLKARMAKSAGCQGVVCSGLEVAAIKKELGPEFLAVTPGIRPAWSVISRDDQKRIVTPYDAIKNGADYVVIGRPIRDAKDPSDAALRVAEEIDSAL